MTDDASESILDERLVIETPERVAIVHDLAGVGSRFAAGLLDVLILGFVFLVLGILFLLLAGIAMPQGEQAQFAFATSVTGAYSVVLVLYYVGFEWAWRGQTPGKRALRLRVVADGGVPATPAAVFVRNLLRVVDLLPLVAPYGLAGVVMFANRRAKRIGDFAAGTIVVRERPEPYAPPAPSAVEGDALGAADLARVRSFVARARELLPERREALARAIAEDVAARHGLAADDPAALLRALASGRTPREIREAQGPRP